MLKVEGWLMLRDLAREMEITTGKVNISEIARQTGYDRRTVRKYLRAQSHASLRNLLRCMRLRLYHLERASRSG